MKTKLYGTMIKKWVYTVKTGYFLEVQGNNQNEININNNLINTLTIDLSNVNNTNNNYNNININNNETNSYVNHNENLITTNLNLKTIIIS